MNNIARPLKTRRNLEIINAERKSLGLPPSLVWSAEKSDDVVVGIDVEQMVRSLKKDHLWRLLFVEMCANLLLLILLCVYLFSFVWVNHGYWNQNHIANDLYLRSFANSQEQYLPPPSTSSPLARNERVVNCTSPSGNETCAAFSTTSALVAVRDQFSFQQALLNAMEHSPILKQQNPVVKMLGRMRVRQLRVKNTCASSNQECYPLYSSGNNEEANITMKHPNPNVSSAFAFQQTSQLSQFETSDGVINADYSFMNTKTRGQYFDTLYPKSGYAFDFPNCAAPASEWKQLIESGWMNRSTRVVFVQFTLYDMMSNSFVFVDLATEFFPVGMGVNSIMDARAFRIPSSNVALDASFPLRVVLLIVTLAQLVLSMYRLVRDRFSSCWAVLDLTTASLLQAALWLTVSASVDPLTVKVNSNENLALFHSCNYSTNVQFFGQVAYDAATAFTLFGFAFLLIGCKFLQVSQYYRRLSFQQAVVTKMSASLWGWFVLALCFIFFFAFGGAFLFGAVLPPFRTIWNAIVFTFVLSSDVEGFNKGGAASYYNSFTPLLTSVPWALYDKAGQLLSLFDMAQLASYHATAAIYSFALWVGLLILLVNWLLKNLLLGIILKGGELVIVDVLGEEQETRERRRRGENSFGSLARLCTLHQHFQLRRLLRALEEGFDLVKRGWSTEEDIASVIGLDLHAKHARLFAQFQVELRGVNEALLLLHYAEHGRGVAEEEEDFDPHAQTKWHALVQSGALLQSLAFVHTLRARRKFAALRARILDVDRRQASAVKELRTVLAQLARFKADASKERSVWEIGQERKLHGIETRRNARGDVEYHVHYAREKRYRYVGAYGSMQEAEQAFQRVKTQLARVGEEDNSLDGSAGEEELEEEDFDLAREKRERQARKSKAARARGEVDVLVDDGEELRDTRPSKNDKEGEAKEEEEEEVVVSFSESLKAFLRRCGGWMDVRDMVMSKELNEVAVMDSKGLWHDPDGNTVTFKKPRVVNPLASIRYENLKNQGNV